MQNDLAFGIILSLLIIFIGLLSLEVFIHNRRLRSIPVRIAVSGTRGKTSVTRMLASILRESGRVVLAKTTGTEARYIFPDGTEQEVKRSGQPNILEQKKLVRKAAQLKAEFLVVETMSIHPENHLAETFRLIKPHYTILTNLRPDHLDAAQGKSMDFIYRNDIYPGASLVIPQDELTDSLRGITSKRKVKLITVDPSPFSSINQEIASRLAKEFGVADSFLAKGISKSKMDQGEACAFEFNGNGGNIIFINAFAANDPVSSSLMIDSIKRSNNWQEYPVCGLLSLRADRGERSRQWLDFLKAGAMDKFDRLYFTGSHGRVLKRKLNCGELFRDNNPESITKSIIKHSSGPCLVFGLVNIGGTGLKLIEYWANSGKSIELNI